MTYNDRGGSKAESIGRLVRAYDTGQTSFAEMVQGIDFTIVSMGVEVDPAWVDEFRTTWGPLEIVFASMLDEGRTTMTDDETSIVRESVDAFLAMTTPY